MTVLVQILRNNVRDLEEWERGHTTEEITGGLPEIAARDNRALSIAAGAPVDAVALREALGHLDADAEYGPGKKYQYGWRDIVAAIGNANCPEAREIAHEWSEGRLDRLKRYEHRRPSRYDGPERVDFVLDTMPPKQGGVGVGTIEHHAHEAGWTGTLAPRAPAAEVFHAFLQKAADEEAGEGPQPIGELLSRPVEPVQELIAGLVERGVPTFFSGGGGSNKSRTGLHWGMAVDAGVPIYGRPVQRATFVYVSAEDHQDEVTRRVQAIARRLSLKSIADE